MKPKIIIDTNIIFSALLNQKNKYRNEIIFNDTLSFYSCKYSVIEIFKHKEKILKISKLKEEQILECFYELLKNIELFNEKLISTNNWKKAYNLCYEIDPKDIPFIALTLELEGQLWSGDKALKTALIKKNFNNFYQM